MHTRAKKILDFWFKETPPKKRFQKHEGFDIDGDGQQELITAIRRGSPRGTLIVSLQAGDDLVHNSGGGLETWVTEFQTNSSIYGGGSPYHALPADLNGDGKYELVNHHWNNFNLYMLIIAVLI